MSPLAAWLWAEHCATNSKPALRPDSADCARIPPWVSSAHLLFNRLVEVRSSCLRLNVLARFRPEKAERRPQNGPLRKFVCCLHRQMSCTKHRYTSLTCVALNVVLLLKFACWKGLLLSCAPRTHTGSYIPSSFIAHQPCLEERRHALGSNLHLRSTTLQNHVHGVQAATIRNSWDH